MSQRIRAGASWGAIVLMCVVAIVVTAGLAVGYRPVAITTGSMDPWAPTGAVVIAGPVASEDILVGDVLVMRIDGQILVTHRVMELQRQRGQLQAITQGDANAEIDPFPYVLGEEELRGRWAVPGLGRLLVALNYQVVLLLVVAGALATIALALMRWIWAEEEPDEKETNEKETDSDSSDSDSSDPDGSDVDEGSPPEKPSFTPEPKRAPSAPVAHRRRRAVAMPVASALVTLLMADVSYALYTSAETVGANIFSTLNCAAADGITMQSGTAVSNNSGVTTATITAVDPAKAFLMFSIRSNQNVPRDSMVRGELTNGTTVSFYRNTINTNRPINIEWSVVEYACGVTVQRGAQGGSGGTVQDIALPITIDSSQSFAIASTVPGATYTTYDRNEMVRAEVLNDTTVRLRSYFLESFMTYGWQVISFDEPGVASVQKVSTFLGVGDTAATLTLPTSVDTTKTFVIGGIISNAPGTAIGEQAVRVALTSGTTVEVTRSLGTQTVDVQVQVVTLNDGSVVQSGVVDLATAQSTGTAALAAVDLSIATTMSTSNLPGSMSGGRSAYSVTDRVGEASATFVLTNATTLTVQRNTALADASFGWQVIEWAK